MILTAMPLKEYHELPFDRCVVKGKIEVKIWGKVVAVLHSKTEASGTMCKSRKEAQALFSKILQQH